MCTAQSKRAAAPQNSIMHLLAHECHPFGRRWTAYALNQLITSEKVDSTGSDAALMSPEPSHPRAQNDSYLLLVTRIKRLARRPLSIYPAHCHPTHSSRHHGSLPPSAGGFLPGCSRLCISTGMDSWNSNFYRRGTSGSPAPTCLQRARSGPASPKQQIKTSCCLLPECHRHERAQRSLWLWNPDNR